MLTGLDRRPGRLSSSDNRELTILGRSVHVGSVKCAYAVQSLYVCLNTCGRNIENWSLRSILGFVFAEQDTTECETKQQHATTQERRNGQLQDVWCIVGNGHMSGPDSKVPYPD